MTKLNRVFILADLRSLEKFTSSYANHIRSTQDLYPVEKQKNISILPSCYRPEVI
jgi:hypothetical protein